jgi:hypothetical protein
MYPGATMSVSCANLVHSRNLVSSKIIFQAKTPNQLTLWRVWWKGNMAGIRGNDALAGAGRASHDRRKLGTNDPGWIDSGQQREGGTMTGDLGWNRADRMLRSGRWQGLIRAFAIGTVLARAMAIEAAEIRVDGRTFRIPDGFTIEPAAGSPLVDRPITAAFDDQGRLYVADSSGSNDNVQKQLAEKPHRILRLEDSDRDGKFDKRTVFADRMMFPEGTMWLGDSLYVAAPPSIWKLTDTDGDGVADRRVEWFQGRTLTGCANDLHGPYPGPDGWIYWCKGAFARQT